MSKRRVGSSPTTPTIIFFNYSMHKEETEFTFSWKAAESLMEILFTDKYRTPERKARMQEMLKQGDELRKKMKMK